MKSYDLNELPELIENGKLSRKEAVDIICSFICQNYKVFNLQKYDEDFRSELLIYFLEKGEKVFTNYNPKLGDFFTFLYCYINSLVITKMRSTYLNNAKEKLLISEAINSIIEYEPSSIAFTPAKKAQTKVPYKPSVSNLDELRQLFAHYKPDNDDKKIIVLAIKSSFYITDEQIQKICNLYKIDINYFYEIIEYCKQSIQDKTERRIKMEQRRNYDYYHSKRYENELIKLHNSETQNKNLQLEEKLTYKKNKHYNNWKKLNDRLENGCLYLRPTTKTISKLLGICERQINYYINCAKKDAEKKTKENEKEKKD